jgi:hypothetical protein
VLSNFRFFLNTAADPEQGEYLLNLL